MEKAVFFSSSEPWQYAAGSRQCLRNMYSGVTRVFGAPQSHDVGLTPAFLFSVKGTLWLPEVSIFLQCDI